MGCRLGCPVWQACCLLRLLSMHSAVRAIWVALYRSCLSFILSTYSAREESLPAEVVDRSRLGTPFGGKVRIAETGSEDWGDDWKRRLGAKTGSEDWERRLGAKTGRDD